MQQLVSPDIFWALTMCHEQSEMLYMHYFIQFSQQLHKAAPVTLLPHFADEGNWGSQRLRLAQGHTNKKWNQDSIPNLLHAQWPITSEHLGLEFSWRVITSEPRSKCPPDLMAISSEFKTCISLKAVSNLGEWVRPLIFCLSSMCSGLE